MENEEKETVVTPAIALFIQAISLRNIEGAMIAADDLQDTVVNRHLRKRVLEVKAHADFLGYIASYFMNQSAG